MNSIFIPTLSAEQLRVLQLACINFVDFQLAEEAGLIVEEALLESVLGALRARIGHRGPTQYNGIERVYLDTTVWAVAEVPAPDLNVNPAAEANPTAPAADVPIAELEVAAEVPAPVVVAKPALPPVWTPSKPIKDKFKGKPEMLALFVDVCSASIAELMVRPLPAGLDIDAELKALKKLLVQKIREAKDIEAQVTAQTFNMEVFGEEYDNLRRVSKILDVVAEGNKIMVYTDLLYAPSASRWHEIGKMRIELHQGATSPLWFNLTRLVNGHQAGMHAPHIWANSTACLGNSAPHFITLFQQRQWHVAASMAIMFAESTNLADSAGKHITSWPMVPNEVALAPRPTREPVKDADYMSKRQSYMNACLNRMDQLAVTTRHQLIALRNEIEGIEAKIVYYGRLKLLGKRKAAGGRFYDRAEMAAEFERLRTSARVKDVTVEPGIINVCTHNLTTTDAGGTKYELGEFVIRIIISGKGDSLRFFNQDRTVDASFCKQNAPNVLTSGRACLSEVKANFPDLIGKMQFTVLTQMAIDFIEQSGKAGGHLINWPVLK